MSMSWGEKNCPGFLKPGRFFDPIADRRQRQLPIDWSETSPKSE